MILVFIIVFCIIISYSGDSFINGKIDKLNAVEYEQVDCLNLEHCVPINDEYFFYSMYEEVIVTFDNDYDVVPILEISGNIEYDILNNQIGFNSFKLFLSQVKGFMEIEFSFDGTIIRKNINSSYHESKYSVNISTNNDVLKIESFDLKEDHIENNLSKISNKKNISNVSVNDLNVIMFKGNIKWADDKDNLHNLIETKMRIYFIDHSGAFCQPKYVTTNLDGYFEFPIESKYQLVYLNIILENNQIMVLNDNSLVYSKGYMLNVSNQLCNIEINTHDEFCRASQVFVAANSYANYANTLLTNGICVPMCKIVYPFKDDPDELSDDGNCYYSKNIDTIFLCEEKFSRTNFPSVAGSWDVIGHEYGHHLQHHFFDIEFGGSHKDCNCLYYLITQKYKVNSLYDYRVGDIKEEAIKLAFNEAWATFFSIVAQKSFDRELLGINGVPKLGDDY